MYNPKLLRALGLPIYDTTTNLFFFNLDQKGEKIERQVYSIWDLLADCGGFRDGIMIVVGSICIAFDSEMFS